MPTSDGPRPKIFYGWYILAACVVIELFGLGFGVFAITTVYPFIIDTFPQWSRTVGVPADLDHHRHRRRHGTADRDSARPLSDPLHLRDRHHHPIRGAVLLLDGADSRAVIGGVAAHRPRHVQRNHPAEPGAGVALVS